MIQLVSKRPLPRELQGKHWLTDPDLLISIAGSIRGNPADNSAVREFGLVLSDLRMGGTWKRTNPDRLAATHRALCEHLSPSSLDGIRVLDVGASDGLTTMELHDALCKRFGADTCVTLADLNLWLDRFKKGPLIEYRAGDGEPIMVKVGMLGLRLARNRHNQEQSGGRLASMYIGFDRLRTRMKLNRRISLVNPLVHDRKGLNIIELDCLRRVDSLARNFDAVRVSNLLNLDYFAPTDIFRILTNLHGYLVDGGCLVVSRNDDSSDTEQENGTIWRKTPLRFVRIAAFGRGSEVGQYVTDWTLR